MHCARQLPGHYEGIGDFPIFEAVALGPLTRKPQVQRCGSERYRGHIGGTSGAHQREVCPGSVENCRDLHRRSDGASGVSAEVRHASAQVPAYGPTHVLAVYDLLAKNDLDDGGRR
jgi:hypothetical protein